MRFKSLKFFSAVFVLVACCALSAPAHGKDILLIGDSHTCGHFGAGMAKDLRQGSANRVTIYCGVSSSPANWIKGQAPRGFVCNTCEVENCGNWLKNPSEASMPKCGGTGKMPTFKSILEKKQYDQVVVAMGTNSLPAAPGDAYAEMVKEIKQAKVSSCDWIGPPHLDPKKNARAAEMERGLEKFYQGLNTKVGASGDCPVIDSRDSTAFPKPADTDRYGVHRSKASAAEWVKDVAPKVLKNRGDFDPKDAPQGLGGGSTVSMTFISGFEEGAR